MSIGLLTRGSHVVRRLLRRLDVES